MQNLQPKPADVDNGLGVAKIATRVDASHPNVLRARPAILGQTVGAAAVEPHALPGPARFADVSAELRYADFGARVAAAVIDFVILHMASMFLGSMFFGVLLGHLNPTTILVATLGPPMVSGVFAFFYCVWLESSSWQATLGKKILRLKVVDLHGRRIGLGASSCRNLAKSLSILTMGIGYLMPLWTVRKQTMHDRAAGCLVIRAV